MRTLTITAAPVKQPQELFLQVGRKRYQVASIEQAVAMHNEAREASEHGASKFPRVTIVNANGAHLYDISYNGRVWQVDAKGERVPLDGMNEAEWLTGGGRKLEAMVARGELSARAVSR